MIDKLPGGKLRRRGAHLKAAVLSAVLESVNEYGIRGFSVSDVAHRAGVHETSVYRRWSESRALLVAALYDRTDETLPVPDTGSLRGNLLAHLSQVADYLASPTGRASLQIAAATVQSDASEKARDDFWSSRSTVVELLLERARKTGEIVDVPDPEIAYELLAAPLYMRVLLTGRPIDEDYLTRIVDSFLRESTS